MRLMERAVNRALSLNLNPAVQRSKHAAMHQYVVTLWAVAFQIQGCGHQVNKARGAILYIILGVFKFTLFHFILFTLTSFPHTAQHLVKHLVGGGVPRRGEVRGHQVHQAGPVSRKLGWSLCNSFQFLFFLSGLIADRAKKVQPQTLWAVASRDEGKCAVIRSTRPEAPPKTREQTSFSRGLTSALKVLLLRYTPKSSSTCCTAVSGSPTTCRIRPIIRL